MIIKNLKLKIPALLLVVLIVCSLTQLSSCFVYDASNISEEQWPTLADTLTERVEDGCEKHYSYVANYLEYWTFPNFDPIKLKYVERYYNSQYFKDLGYSDYNSLISFASRTALEYISTELAALSLDEVNDKSKNTDAIIRAYVSAVGDKYSVYRNAEEHENYMLDLGGSFAGIGVYVQLDYTLPSVVVLETIEGSAADAAGIMSGDLIVNIDGTSINDVDLQTFIDLFKGEIGTKVSVTVERGGEQITFEMNRVQIEEKTVDYELYDDGVAYVIISSFNANTDEQFIEIIDEIEQTGRVKGYIFDLRYNGGGYLDTAINLLSHFVANDTKIVSHTTNFGKRWYASNSDHTIDLPCAVICNGYTASAGELFTAAIRDYRDAGILDAVIVGEKTYSKGQIQNIYSLPDGSSVTFTIGLFNPPSDVNFDGVGITPDVLVEFIPDPEKDNQYDTAYSEILKLINK